MSPYSSVIRTKQDIFNLAKDYDLTIYISERYYSMLVIDIKKNGFIKFYLF